MDYYPDFASSTVFDRLDVVIRAMDGCAAVSTALRNSILLPPTHGYDKPRANQKYVRVWSQHWTNPTHCPSCEAQVKIRLRAGHFDYTLKCDHEKPPKESQRFVAFFVELANGDVWKAAGWKAPALNFPRGNIMTPEGRTAITFGKMGDNAYYYPGF